MNPDSNKPDEIVLDQVLNNVDFDYTPYRNYNPILKNGKKIYYYTI